MAKSRSYFGALVPFSYFGNSGVKLGAELDIGHDAVTIDVPDVDTCIAVALVLLLRSVSLRLLFACFHLDLRIDH